VHRITGKTAAHWAFESKTEMTAYPNSKRFIGGRWCGGSRKNIAVSRPATDEVIGELAHAGGRGHPELAFVVIEGSGRMRNRLDVRRGDRVKELGRNPDP